MPQKQLSVAKSRLDLPDEYRRRLALAMLQDTVAALSGVMQLRLVLIAWEEPTDMHRLSSLPKIANLVVPGSDLNSAISVAENSLAERFPRSSRIVFPGDLPACRQGEVAGLLRQAARNDRSFLRDVEGSGTTVLTARASSGLSPEYGHRSARHHLVSGARALDADSFPSLTRDVDTLADLDTALGLGVGPATYGAARELGLVPHLRPGTPENEQRETTHRASGRL